MASDALASVRHTMHSEIRGDNDVDEQPHRVPRRPREAAVLDEQTLVPELPELPWQLRLGLVFVDEKPTVFALYRRANGETGGKVTAWLIALPGDNAVLLPVDGDASTRPILTTLHSVRRRWLRVYESELVQVVGPQAQHMV
jgi:hypothetical protein